MQTEQFDIDEMLAEGDTVVVLGRERGTARKTGAVFATDFAHVWSVRSGKVSKGVVYADTHAAGVAFGAESREQRAFVGSQGAGSE